jgi:hypothetical protein
MYTCTAIDMYFAYGPTLHAGHYMHYAALDEAHEMCINREGKASIVRPTKDNLSRLIQFFPYRSKAMKNLKEQLHLKPCIQQLPQVGSSKCISLKIERFYLQMTPSF